MSNAMLELAVDLNRIEDIVRGASSLLTTVKETEKQRSPQIFETIHFTAWLDKTLKRIETPRF